MDELGKWFLDVFTSINGSGRLGPPAASKKRVSALLEQIGGEGVLQISELLDAGDGEAVQHLARCQPDLGQRLDAEQPQKALDEYFDDKAEFFEPYRKFATRSLSMPPGGTAVSFASPGEPGSAGGEAWEKVFQVLMGRKGDGQESGNL